MRFFLLSCFAVLAVSHPLLGQSIVNGQFIVFPRTADNSKLELIAGEGEFHEVTPSYGRFSKPFPIKGLTTWTLGKSGTDDEGNPTFEEWASCKSTGGKNQTIILFRKGPKNEDGFKAFAFDSDNKGFGKKKFLVFNMTQTEVGGIIGKQKFKLSPNKRTIVQPEGDLEENLCFATFAVKSEGKWVSISSANWPIFDNLRGLVFVYTDPKSKKYRIHAIRDFLK